MDYIRSRKILLFTCMLKYVHQCCHFIIPNSISNIICLEFYFFTQNTSDADCSPLGKRGNRSKNLLLSKT